MVAGLVLKKAVLNVIISSKRLGWNSKANPNVFIWNAKAAHRKLAGNTEQLEEEIQIL